MKVYFVVEREGTQMKAVSEQKMLCEAYAKRMMESFPEKHYDVQKVRMRKTEFEEFLEEEHCPKLIQPFDAFVSTEREVESFGEEYSNLFLYLFMQLGSAETHITKYLRSMKTKNTIMDSLCIMLEGINNLIGIETSISYSEEDSWNAEELLRFYVDRTLYEEFPF